jgi:hypothetical protein
VELFEMPLCGVLPSGVLLSAPCGAAASTRGTGVFEITMSG